VERDKIITILTNLMFCRDLAKYSQIYDYCEFCDYEVMEKLHKEHIEDFRIEAEKIVCYMEQCGVLNISELE